MPTEGLVKWPRVQQTY